MQKKFSLLTILIFILATMAGCSNETSNTNSQNFCVVTDDAGRTVELAKKPERIVAISASFLEPLNAVGGEVVGRPSSKNKLPDFAKDAADIGPVYQIDTEKLLACTPDLVLLNKGMNERLSALLDENKIPFLILDMKTYDNVKKNIETFATITAQPEKGKQIVEAMDLEIKNIVNKLPKEKKRVAILHSTAQDLSVQLDNSIAGNVVKILGWENVAQDLMTADENDTVPYSLETLIEQNPEIIFITSMGDIDEIKNAMDKRLAENDAWQTIPAVKNNHFYYLPQDLFLLSPGIHYPDAVKFMAQLIYPESAE
ncbi:MAG: ABC transporter substrate-binding protein [Selenomonadaceae bacterium]|nr:ABC transporter substrate-binding protein [Selenomonadaceae bacterium]